MSMQIAETADQTDGIRHLTDSELDSANGGFIWIAAFAIGAAVGYGCRKAGEWTVGQLLGE